MMTLQNICKSYNGKPVLRGVTLTVAPGITCLMGLSGSDKTTLLRILLGLEKPGTIRRPLPGRPADRNADGTREPACSARQNMGRKKGRSLSEQTGAT